MMMSDAALWIASLRQYRPTEAVLHRDLECVQAPALPATGLTSRQAEDMLDWLEATGHHGGRLSFVPGEGFTVEPGR